MEGWLGEAQPVPDAEQPPVQREPQVLALRDPEPQAQSQASAVHWLGLPLDLQALERPLRASPPLAQHREQPQPQAWHQSPLVRSEHLLAPPEPLSRAASPRLELLLVRSERALVPQRQSLLLVPHLGSEPDR